MIRLRYDYNKKLTCSFFAPIESHRGIRRGSTDAAVHDVIVYVTTYIMAFMQEKEVENLINLYQMETSLWDTNDKTYYDDNSRIVVETQL